MPLADTDLSAIRELIERDGVAMRTGDSEAVGALFTQDAIRHPPGHAPMMGHHAIRTDLEQYPALPDFEFDPIEIDGEGDFGFVRGTYSLTVPGDGVSTRGSGSYLAIVERQADGSWLWKRDMWTIDEST